MTPSSLVRVRTALRGGLAGMKRGVQVPHFSTTSTSTRASAAPAGNRRKAVRASPKGIEHQQELQLLPSARVGEAVGEATRSSQASSTKIVGGREESSAAVASSSRPLSGTTEDETAGDWVQRHARDHKGTTTDFDFFLLPQPAHATLLLRHKSKADLWVPLKVHEAVDVQRAEMENNTDSSSESDHNHHYDYLFEWRKSYLEEEIGQVFLSVGDDVLFTSNDKPFAVPEHKFGGKASKIFRKQQLHTSGTTSSSSSSSSTTNPPGSNGSRLSNYLKYVYARKARKFPKLHWIQKLLTNEQSAAQWLFLKQANDIVFRVCGLRPKFFDSTNSSYDLMLLGEKRILSRVSSNVSHDEPTTRAVYAGWEGSEVAFDFLIVYVHKQLDPARSQNKGAKSKWVKPNADAADGGAGSSPRTSSSGSTRVTTSSTASISAGLAAAAASSTDAAAGNQTNSNSAAGESPSLPSNWQRSRSHRSEHVSVGAAAAGAPASVLNGSSSSNPADLFGEVGTTTGRLEGFFLFPRGVVEKYVEADRFLVYPPFGTTSTAASGCPGSWDVVGRRGLEARGVASSAANATGVMENNVNGAAGGGSAGAAADSAWQRQYYIDLHDSHAKFLTILRRGPDGLEDTPEGAARD